MKDLPAIDFKKLLQGHYEAKYLPKNISPEYIVPDFAFNILNPLGLLYKPVVDEYFLKNRGKKPTWPEAKPFAVCLTHDVDVVSFFSLKQSIRARQAQLSRAGSVLDKMKGILGPGIDLLREIRYSGQKDPLHCYERWLQVEKEVGAHSTLFFWPGYSSLSKRHYTDCLYDLYDLVKFDNQKCTVAEMIKEIDRQGWEIGLHSSWYSFDDADELKRQKEALENILRHEIFSVRQHTLHYDIRITPSVHASAGFKYDSTLGFNDNVGFRFGTCYPWYLYDLKKYRELPVMEVPLIVEDVALLYSEKGLRLNEEIAFQYIILMSEAVEKVSGVLTLLWHPRYIIKPEWWRLYQRALKYLNHKNVWFASVTEIGEWWKKQRK